MRDGAVLPWAADVLAGCEEAVAHAVREGGALPDAVLVGEEDAFKDAVRAGRVEQADGRVLEGGRAF